MPPLQPQCAGFSPLCNSMIAAGQFVNDLHVPGAPLRATRHASPSYNSSPDVVCRQRATRTIATDRNILVQCYQTVASKNKRETGFSASCNQSVFQKHVFFSHCDVNKIRLLLSLPISCLLPLAIVVYLTLSSQWCRLSGAVSVYSSPISWANYRLYV